MQNYKELCGDEKEVWIEISPGEGEEFLQWAKDLGCVWINGKQIVPSEGANSFHFAIHNDGTLANVAMFVWVHKQFEGVAKYMFSPLKHGERISPKEYYSRNKK